MSPLIWALLLLLVALLLIGLELFVPSGGLISILAVVSVLAAVIVGFRGGIRDGSIVLLLTTVLVPLVIAIVLKWWPNTPIGRLVLIQPPKQSDVVMPAESILKAMVGKTGKAKSELLPAGAIVVEGRTYDAVSDGMAIEAGDPIKIIAIRTNSIVVRPLNQNELAELNAEGDEEGWMSRPIDSLGIDPIDDPLA